jgi:WD40 repeat protein
MRITSDSPVKKLHAFQLLLSLPILVIFPDLLSAQPIFRADKPVIQAVWHRVADYSPTLRSVETAEFSPDGRLIVSGAKFGNYLMLWDVADGSLVWQRVLEAEVEAVTFSPDGKFIAAGDEAQGPNRYILSEYHTFPLLFG